MPPQIGSGDQQASEDLLPLVYEELRRLAAARMANERADHTMSATVLVHEAYVWLVDEGAGKRWVNRSLFFKAAAEAMRRTLAESAGRKQATKLGGDFERFLEDPIDLPGVVHPSIRTG